MRILYLLTLIPVLLCSCAKVSTYPSSVTRPTPFDELEGLLIPYEGYTILKFDQTVVYIDVDPSDRLGEATVKLFIYQHDGESLAKMDEFSMEIDTKLGGNDTINLFDGVNIEFIDAHMISNSGYDGYFFSERLPLETEQSLDP